MDTAALLYVLAWRQAFQRVGKQIVATSILHKIGRSSTIRV